MKNRLKIKNYFFAIWFSLFLISTLLLVPFKVHADPLILVRTAYKTDMDDISVIKKAKLSATLKLDKNGDMVIQCLNLFSIPVARTPFAHNPGIQNLAQRTLLKVEPKGKGVFVKLTFLF